MENREFSELYGVFRFAKPNMKEIIYMNGVKINCILSLISFALLCLLVGQAWCDFAVVQNNAPACSVVVPENPSLQEEYAVEELLHFVEKFTGVILPEMPDSQPLPAGNVILIGSADNNRYIDELYNKGVISREKELDEEEFIIRVVSDSGRDLLVVAGGQNGGVIYGVYTLVEKMIEGITNFTPADVDFYVPRVRSVVVGAINMRDAPFYPVRCSLTSEDSTWLSRHRINASGAEGVWSGTGLDDGLSTAFKYVDDKRFDDMQDESFDKRQDRISELKSRLIELKTKGIDSYLFMYVMGEPTKAMLANHPELLGDTVYYRHSRNGSWYRPLSWTNPESRELIKDLVKSIVRTYSPWLSGFHLRSWGAETFAPAGNGNDQQKLLWEVYYDIVDAAREVDPDFKFLISGYDQSWLRDPGRTYAAQLPEGTLFMRKWGLDGEPVSDPGVPFNYINSIGSLGERVLIFSHDVEEVVPLWMIEADLFVEGVRKYADNPAVNGLGGFTLQGEGGMAHIDKIVSSRIVWNPHLDYVALMRNYFTSYYGPWAADRILLALRTNGATLSDYFTDHAGSLSLTGGYGYGSYGYGTKLWSILGEGAVEDTLSMPDMKTVAYAKGRFMSLLPRQQEAANEMMDAANSIWPATEDADRDYFDALHIMKMWVRFFESRLRLVEAREAELRGDIREQIMQKLSSAMEYAREMQAEISEIKKFTPVFNYNDDSARKLLVDTIAEEIEFLRNFVPAEVNDFDEPSQSDEELALAIEELISHPNPNDGRATFCYNLASYADEVTIIIYNIRGKRVRTIAGASAEKGYNEESWIAEDDDGSKLANGVYFYKMVAERDDERVQEIGKLSILR